MRGDLIMKDQMLAFKKHLYLGICENILIVYTAGIYDSISLCYPDSAYPMKQFEPQGDKYYADQ